MQEMGKINCIPRHGGDIYGRKVEYDFSVNVNPLGIPQVVEQALKDMIRKNMSYPQYGNSALQEAIASELKIPTENVLCGNGASELFAAVVHALKPREVVIPVPSFYGYEWAAGMEKANIHYIPLKVAGSFAVTQALCDHLTEKTDLLFLANPNNPAGNCIQKDLLYQIMDQCKKQGIMVVLDESFIEFTGKEGALKLTEEFGNLIVVRSFTKIFAIPGIRLGYLAAQPDLCKKIKRQLPEWNISVQAQAAGLALCAKDWGKDSYLRKTMELVKTEREYLVNELKKIFHEKITIFPSETNYLLLKTDVLLYKKLLEHGILIRDCSNYRGLGNGYYRIAVKEHEENAELVRGVVSMVLLNKESEVRGNA